MKIGEYTTLQVPRIVVTYMRMLQWINDYTIQTRIVNTVIREKVELAKIEKKWNSLSLGGLTCARRPMEALRRVDQMKLER